MASDPSKHSSSSPSFQNQNAISSANRSDSGQISVATPERALNQKGFGTIILLAVIPLLIAALFSSLVALSVTQLVMGSRQICRQGLLDVETVSAKALVGLKLLNAQIAQLRIQEAATRLALAAAIASENPVAAAQAFKELKRIENAFVFIDRAQFQIFQSLERTQNILAKETSRAFTSRTQNLATKVAAFITIRAQPIQLEIPRLAVRPDRPGQAPIYEPEDPFIEKQSAHGFWRISVQTQSSQWLNRWLAVRTQWKGVCGASLREEKNSWMPILITPKKARFF